MYRSVRDRTLVYRYIIAPTNQIQYFPQFPQFVVRLEIGGATVSRLASIWMTLANIDLLDFLDNRHFCLENIQGSGGVKDKKSQIQALDRTQPGLPLKKGHAGTMTHDYKRHGTTTFFAALNVLDGKVIGACMPKHRQDKFLKFLKKIDAETPSGIDIHLVVDNYGSHKTKRVKEWLGKHPRFHMHFTPTSASWLNMVERFFSEITTKKIRRGVFKSLQALIDAIMDFVEKHNENQRIFT